MKVTISQLRGMVQQALTEKKKKKKKKGGKKDACYHKVKARYDVWPSAYASGALVKCRKVGAANWGNKSKKEGIEQDPLRDMIREAIAELAEKKTNKRIPRKKGQKAKSKKHSDLYTDEDPKGTIHGLKFATEADAKKSVTKIRNSSRSHAHKVQAAVAMEQRAKAAGKASAAAVYRKYINSVKKDEIDRNHIRDLVETEISRLGESDSEGLRKWFGRKGEKGSKSGWVDCNTCRKDKKTGRKKCSACGRESGEKRAKYPKCRPTPSACSKRGNYGKKSKAGKKG
tara:strand:+ start:923 stop:1777 length:855 start_codon:yes stop_codon:yes gene_type:complete